MRRRDLLAGWLAATMASALRAAGPNKVYRLAFVSSVADPSKTGQYEPLFVERRPGYVEVGRFSAKTVCDAGQLVPPTSILVTGTSQLFFKSKRWSTPFPWRR